MPFLLAFTLFHGRLITQVLARLQSDLISKRRAIAAAALNIVINWIGRTSGFLGSL
jgi:hypothetical protein